MIPNEALHHKVWRALNTDEVAEPNVFAIGAAIAAFTKGEDWLEELRAYLFDHCPDYKYILLENTIPCDFKSV